MTDTKASPAKLATDTADKAGWREWVKSLFRIGNGEAKK